MLPFGESDDEQDLKSKYLCVIIYMADQKFGVN